MTNNFFNNMFMKVQNGMCKLSPYGIAVKTSAGYRTYNTKTGRLRNCDNVVFNFGDGFFFVIPTTKAAPGDIILRNGQPVCVRSAGKNSIEVINYETSAVETLLPERHVFMGNTYFYGKIVSIFGNGASICGKGNVTKMMKYMMLSNILGGQAGMHGGTGIDAGGLFQGQGMNNMNAMLPFMLMGGNGLGDMFDGLFDEDMGFDPDIVPGAEEEEEEEEE